MRTLDDIIAFIAGQCDICDALRAVAALDLPDAWIAAGFIRAAIWDHLHARPYARPHGDVDVIYFDPVHIDPNADAAIEDALRAAAPSYDWSVKNQTLMHARNGDAPYGDSANAMTHWPERCSHRGAMDRERHCDAGPLWRGGHCAHARPAHTRFRAKIVALPPTHHR